MLNKKLEKVLNGMDKIGENYGEEMKGKLEKLQIVLEALGQSGEEISYLDLTTDTFYQIHHFLVLTGENIVLVGQGIVEDSNGKQINEDGVTLSINLENIEDINIDICGIDITYVDNTVVSLEADTDTMANILDNIEGVDWENLSNEEIEEVYADYYKEENTRTSQQRKLEDLEETSFYFQSKTRHQNRG